MAFYIDTSAALKLVVREKESIALMDWLLKSNRNIVSCDLLRTELIRASRRVHPRWEEKSRAVIESIGLIKLTPSICERAGKLDPPALRSLDAIHIASALQLENELEGLVTYDQQMVDAARNININILMPT